MTRLAGLILLQLLTAMWAYGDEPVGPRSADGAAGPWAAIEPIGTQEESGAARPVGESEKREIRRGTSSTRSTGVAPQDSGSGWTRSLGSLAAVVGVILFLSWGYKATAGKAAMSLKSRRPGLIQIVSRTSLSSRQSLCLVRVGPRMVLVGVGADSLRTLDVIDDADVVGQLAGAAESAKTSPAFKAALERDLSRYEDEQTPAAATPKVRDRIAKVLETLSRAKKTG